MPKKEPDFANIDSFELDNHLILLKKNASRVQVLNPLASMIWQFKKSGLNNLQIAREINNAFDTPIKPVLQEIESINAQLMLDFAISVEDVVVTKKTPSLSKEITDWQSDIVVFLSFPRCTVKVNLDSQIIAEKVQRLFPFIQVPYISFVDMQLDIVSSVDAYLIMKDGLILEQTKTESYTALMVFHHIVELICKHDDWLIILHAAGVSWQGHGIVFPALGGSGKTTLTASLIKFGFEYINDDVIPLLRNTEELVRLPTCLSIKSGSWSLLQTLYPELETLEIFGNQEPKVKYLPPPDVDNSFSTLYAKHIILPNYQAGAKAELEPLSPVMALQAIIEGESLLHLPLDKKDIADLIKWLSPLTCHRLTYDKLDPAVVLLRQFCMDNCNH